MVPAASTFTTKLNLDVHFPKYKLYSYDQSDSWESIINGTNATPATDLTPYVVSIDYTHDQLRVVMADDASLAFHPDGGALRSKIRQGRIIRLKEGFEGLSESDWVWAFSGTVEGTYGWTYMRGSAIQVDFNAFSRNNNQAWRRRPITTRDYTVGADWGEMMYNIAHDIMGLSDTEIMIPRSLSLTFDKNSNQIVSLPAWDAAEGILIGVNARPWFNGEGQIMMVLTSQDRVTLALTNDRLIQKYEAKSSSAETANKIIVTYLSNELSPVEGSYQALGSATITSGFFTSSIDVDVYYSDDRRTRGRNTQLVIKQSANAGLLSFCDETFTQIDEFHSRITVEVSVWAPVLATAMMAALLAAAFIPDVVVTFLFGGVTVPVGRLVESALTIGIMIIMMAIGTGTYEIWGIPYEMVYLEQQHIAQKDGLEFWEEREKEIKNQFISTDARAKIVALNNLFLEVMKEQPRLLVMRNDPRLEPGDIIQFSNGTKFFVDQVKKTIARGGTGAGIMELSGYRCVV